MRVVSILILCLFSTPLFSLNARSGAEVKGQNQVGLSLSPFVEVMMGYSNELVFGDSSPYPYLSRLHWDIQPAVVAGLEGSINIQNVLFFNVAAGSTLNASTGEMTDHDWLEKYFNLVNTEWTHYSLSDIFLTHSLLVDCNTSFRVFRSRSFTLEIMTGFKLIQWGWTDTLKGLDYPEYNYDYLIGYSGIDYDIEYRVPYVGVTISLDRGSFTGGLTFKYSWTVSADDHDFHKLTGYHYYDSVREGRYYGLSVFNRWQWSPVYSLSLSFDLDYIPVIQGYTFKYSRSGYLLGYFPGGAGISYLTGGASLSLDYNY